MGNELDKREIFERLIEAPAARRRVLLESLTEGNAPLRVEVEHLLDLDDDMRDTPDDLGDLVVDQSARFLQDAWDRPREAPPPAQIAGYRVRRRIGAGGMGAVFEIEWHDGTPAALKILHPGLCAPLANTRFRQEAALLERFHHESVAKLYECGEVDLGCGPQPFIVLELVDGDPLLQAARSLTFAQKLEVLIQIAQGLAHVHEQGVLHGDVKPDNVIVRESGSPCIVDFGLAKHTWASRAPVTTMWDWAGTLQYMSPEQLGVTDHPIDVRSDVYALGMLMHETLAGRLPYDLAGCSIGRAMKIIEYADEPLSDARTEPQLASVAPVIRRALSIDAHDRYPSAAELAADLARIRDGARVAAPKVSPRTRRRALAFAKKYQPYALAGLVGVVVLGFDVLRQGSTSEYPSQKYNALLARILAMTGSAKDAEILLPPPQDHASSGLEGLELRAAFAFLSSNLRWDDLRVAAEGVVEAESSQKPDHNPERLALAESYLAQALFQLNRAAEAEEIIMSLVARLDDLESARFIRMDLVQMLMKFGRLDLAISFGEQGLASYKVVQSGSAPQYAQLSSMLVAASLIKGDEQAYAEYLQHFMAYGSSRYYVSGWTFLMHHGYAEECRRFVTDYLEASGGLRQHEDTLATPRRASAFQCLGGILWTEGDYDEGAEAFRAAIELHERLGDTQTGQRASCMQSLGVCLRDAGRFEEALPYLESSFASFSGRLSEDYPRLADSAVTLATCHYLMGEPSKSFPLAQQALNIREDFIESGPSQWFECATMLALVHLERSELSEAALIIRRAAVVAEEQSHRIPLWRVAIFDLARARLSMLQGEPETAEPILRAAHTVIAEERGESMPGALLALEWLAECTAAQPPQA